MTVARPPAVGGRCYQAFISQKNEGERERVTNLAILKKQLENIFFRVGSYEPAKIKQKHKWTVVKLC